MGTGLQVPIGAWLPHNVCPQSPPYTLYLALSSSECSHKFDTVVATTGNATTKQPKNKKHSVIEIGRQWREVKQTKDEEQTKKSVAVLSMSLSSRVVSLFSLMGATRIPSYSNLRTILFLCCGPYLPTEPWFG